MTSRPPLPTSTFEVSPTDEDVDSFHELGYASFERITTDDELEWLRAVYDELFAEKTGAFPGGYFDLARPYDAPGQDRLPQILVPELRVPELRDTTYARNGRRIASALLGVPEDTLQTWGHMILKPARYGSETPWHQDEAYWDIELAYNAIGAWMPLDPATVDSGCLHFVPGSHRGPVLRHRHISDDPAVHGLWTDEAETADAVAVPLPAGGTTFHHPRTLHHAGPNTTDVQRRAYANEFQQAPTRRDVAADHPWVTEGQVEWEKRDKIQAALAHRDARAR